MLVHAVNGITFDDGTVAGVVVPPPLARSSLHGAQAIGAPAGGVGITRVGYEQFERLVDDATRLIDECPCEKGCPSCVQSPKCGNLNEPLNKNGSIELMRRIASV